MTTVSNALSGIGMHSMWGFSPSVDVVSLAASANPSFSASITAPSRPVLNILLVQSSDIRHVLRTLSCRLRRYVGGPAPALHFYLLDNPTEVVARHLLLLQLLFDWEVPIRQRAILFLEVFGNCLLTDRTSRYVERKGRELVDLVTASGPDSAGASHPLFDLVDFQHLKYRCRDSLEGIFKSWDTSVPFDLEGLRDTRLRHLYGERYDSRKNVLDWDYQTRVKSVASIIHIKQYRTWRNTGVAFEFGDATYSRANRTMGSYQEGTMKAGKDRGIKKEVQGFWLDIVVGPYVAYGVECERVNKFAEDLFYILNKGTGTEQHRHHTVEVATYNVMAMLWEIETRQVYEMKKKDDIFSGLGEDASDIVLYSGGAEEAGGDDGKDSKKEAEVVDPNKDTNADENKPPPPPGAEVAVVKEAGKSEKSEEEKAKEQAELEERRERKRVRQAAARARNIVATLDNVKIFPMSGDFAATLLGRPKFKNMFDVVVVSQAATNVLSLEGFGDIFKGANGEEGTLIVESGKHVYALMDKQLPELNNRLLEITEKSGWKLANGKKEDVQGLVDLENFAFVKK